MFNVSSKTQVSLVQALVRSGAIVFNNNPRTPATYNFGTTFLGSQTGPITENLMFQIGECLSEAAADWCGECQAVVICPPAIADRFRSHRDR